MASRGGIPVRGQCQAGHVVETTSPKGRLTWRGPCPEQGCVHQVIARAIGRPAPEAGAGADQVIDLTTTATLPSGRTVKKVRAYRDEQTPAGFAGAEPEPVGEPPAEPADRPGADGGPPGVPDDAGGPDDAGAGGGSDDELVADDDSGGRRRRRWPWGRVDRAERDERADVIPGLYP